MDIDPCRDDGRPEAIDGTRRASYDSRMRSRSAGCDAVQMPAADPVVDAGAGVDEWPHAPRWHVAFGVLAVLTGVLLLANDEPGAGRAQSTARENLAEARALIGDLAPPALRGGSLPDALAQLVGRLSGDLGVPPSLRVEGEPRVLLADDDAVLLRVADDGCGFDDSIVAGGYGLSGMRARVEQVGGTFAVHTRVAGGTVVEARL
jgi:hypothetical protein